MPLIILGLILIIGIVIYWIVSNSNLDDGKIDTSPIREHYSHAFEEKAGKARGVAKDVADDLSKKIRKRAGIYDVDYDVEDDGYGNKSPDSSENRGSAASNSQTKPSDNSIPFPRDVEREKRERNEEMFHIF